MNRNGVWRARALWQVILFCRAGGGRSTNGACAAFLALFRIGLLLGLASSPPLAAKNGLSPFYYVTRQGFFGGMALIAMFGVSMMTP